MRHVLGIDIGSSKTAAVLLDGSATPVAARSVAHDALAAGQAAGRHEQMPGVLLASVQAAVQALPECARREVQAIGVSGQMHGVMLLDASAEACGNLISWQDQRCDDAFLATLGAATGYRLRSGYGCATLAWLAAHGCLPAGAACACTVQDHLVARLCGLASPVCDPTTAASWGLYNLKTHAWDSAAAAAAGINPQLLPRILPCGSIAATLRQEQAAAFGLPAGIAVCTAIGDNQASLLATLSDTQREAALTLGTGGQLSVVARPQECIETLPPDAPYEYRPYIDERVLIVASSLCGGSAWKWLADTLQRMLCDAGRQPLDETELYALLNAKGRASDSRVVVHPHFRGERHSPSQRGSIEGLTLTNCTIGNLARGLARGIVRNLADMLPDTALAGKTRVVLSGNALRKNPLLREMAAEVLACEALPARDMEEAATGAAMLAARALEG